MKKGMLISFASVLVFGPSLLLAHPAICSHTHTIYPTRVECDPRRPPAECEVNGEEGWCIERVKYAGIIAYRDCFCVTATGDYQVLAGTAVCQLDSSPSGNAVAMCTFVADADSVMGIWDSDCEVAFTGFEEEFFEGTFELTFGASEVPVEPPDGVVPGSVPVAEVVPVPVSSIPVTITAATISLPSFMQRGSATGTNTFTMNDNAFNAGTYNTRTGVLQTLQGQPAALMLTNDLVSDEAVTMLFGGTVQPRSLEFSFNFQMQHSLPDAGAPLPCGSVVHADLEHTVGKAVDR